MKAKVSAHSAKTKRTKPDPRRRRGADLAKIFMTISGFDAYDMALTREIVESIAKAGPRLTSDARKGA